MKTWLCWPTLSHLDAPGIADFSVFFGSIFESTFLQSLELLRCLLGGFLGSPSLSWRSRRPRSGHRLLVLSLPLFRCLELSMAFLGVSWRVLGRFCAQNGPQNGSKSDPKWVPNWSKKWPEKWTQKIRILDPFWGPKRCPIRRPNLYLFWVKNANGMEHSSKTACRKIEFFEFFL